MKKIFLIMCLLAIFCPVVSFAEQKKAESMPFVVYLDQETDNHYVPSGWIGDWGDLTISDSTDDPYKGKTCLKWIYSAKKSADKGWAGCYWQEPAENWSDKEGGYNLSQAKQLGFCARGEKGGEVITFLMGGLLSGKVSNDTCAAKIESVKLAKEWKRYVIDLKGKDLSNIITGFGFVVTEGKNPQGCTFYLDEITYDK